MKNKFICTILILMLIASSMEIFAVTKSELNNQSSSIDSKISETEDEISEVSSNLSSAMKDVQSLIAQISTYEQSISDLNSKIEETEKQITEKEEEIEKAGKDIEEKQELLDKRLVAMYESGNTSYIELLLSSADLTDFISKYYLISELATYDTELIESIRDRKEQLEKDKVEIENSKVELESSKSELEEKRNALASAKSEKDKKVSNLNSEEKQLKDELEELEKEKKEIQAELARIAKEEAAANGKPNNSGATSPSSAGYIFPVAGCSRSNVSKLVYPSYAGHTGIDVNINVVGKAVVAVKSGTVVISKARTGSIPNYGTDGKYIGSYSSYGEYVVINHHDGTMTLYAHMRPGSRTVKVGDKVNQGQVIGIVGNTGNVSPRPTASKPLNGTHLHFEVRVNGNPVSPIPYLP